MNRHGNHSLSPSDVAEIRALLERRENASREIKEHVTALKLLRSEMKELTDLAMSQDYGVTKNVIHYIKKGLTYKDTP